MIGRDTRTYQIKKFEKRFQCPKYDRVNTDNLLTLFLRYDIESRSNFHRTGPISPTVLVTEIEFNFFVF